MKYTFYSGILTRNAFNTEEYTINIYKLFEDGETERICTVFESAGERARLKAKELVESLNRSNVATLS